VDAQARAAGGSADVRIAIMAPPWIPVPALGYGGIEQVVRLLSEGLVEGDHHGFDVPVCVERYEELYRRVAASAPARS
jgi:hypothetical protein